jgi:hypothetical protein
MKVNISAHWISTHMGPNNHCFMDNIVKNKLILSEPRLCFNNFIHETMHVYRGLRCGNVTCPVKGCYIKTCRSVNTSSVWYVVADFWFRVPRHSWPCFTLWRLSEPSFSVSGPLFAFFSSSYLWVSAWVSFSCDMAYDCFALPSTGLVDVKFLMRLTELMSVTLG